MSQAHSNKSTSALLAAVVSLFLVVVIMAYGTARDYAQLKDMQQRQSAPLEDIIRGGVHGQRA